MLGADAKDHLLFRKRNKHGVWGREVDQELMVVYTEEFRTGLW